MKKTNQPLSFTRRKFLVSTGWMAVGATVIFSSGCSALSTLPTMSDDAEDDALSWLQVLPDNLIRFYMGKSEMGQGSMTGLCQIVADGLHVPLSQVEAVLPHTNLTAPVRMTVGSETIQELYKPLRNAALQYHQSLKTRAAEKTGLSSEELSERPGGFMTVDEGSFIGFGSLVDQEFTIESLSDATLEKNRQRFHSIGRREQRLDLLEKVTGRARYSQDIQLPGMLHGKVARPPVFGATIEKVDRKQADQMPQVIAVVLNQEQNFLGVVAETEKAAFNALEKIKIQWKIHKKWDQKEIEALVDPDLLKKEGKGAHSIVSEGSYEDGKEQAVQILNRKYSTPFGTHAAMETHTGVAYVRKDRADIWVGSQDLWFHQTYAAEITGLDKERINVHHLYAGGAFGGKVGVEAAFEAIRLSNVVKRPVRVSWTREENFQHTYYRTPTLHRIEAGLDKTGEVAFWRHEFGSGPVIFNPSFITGSLKWVTSFIADFGGTRCSKVPYNIANRETDYWDESIPVPTGPWRGLSSSSNVFAIESAMDELAVMAGTDPLKFRLQHLDEKRSRLKRVLQKAGEASGWEQPLGEGRGKGIACAIYKDSTFVAVVAEVSVDQSSGSIVVDRMVCAHDCGLMINPDSVEAQIEGNLIWGYGMALKESMEVEEGRMNVSNFHNFSLLRMHEAPKIEIVLVEDKKNSPSGVGEPALVPVPAAIANAVFNAVGVRVADLPIRLKTGTG